jgi:hypothetical protein
LRAAAARRSPSVIASSDDGRRSSDDGRRSAARKAAASCNALASRRGSRDKASLLIAEWRGGLDRDRRRVSHLATLLDEAQWLSPVECAVTLEEAPKDVGV